VRAAAALALLLAACGGDGVVQRRGELPPAPPDQGFVQIACRPAEVDIYVDGAFAGRLDGYPEGVLRLPRGQRRLELRRRDHYTFYRVVDVGAEGVRIDTHLVPVPPDVQ
jgi:hypothetical protein